MLVRSMRWVILNLEFKTCDLWNKNQFLLEITVLYAGLWTDYLLVKYESKVKLLGLCVGYRLRTFHKSADTNYV